MKKNVKIKKNQNLSQAKIKFEKGDLFSDKCPSRDILKHVTSKWALLIFLALSDGEIKRFSELRRKISGISEKMLGQTLKSLEEDGFVKRVAYEVVPPYVEYSLTKVGIELSTRVINLTDWIEENIVKLMK